MESITSFAPLMRRRPTIEDHGLRVLAELVGRHAGVFTVVLLLDGEDPQTEGDDVVVLLVGLRAVLLRLGAHPLVIPVTDGRHIESRDHYKQMLLKVQKRRGNFIHDIENITRKIFSPDAFIKK